jgi:hypothetical protein
MKKELMLMRKIIMVGHVQCTASSPKERRKGGEVGERTELKQQ